MRKFNTTAVAIAAAFTDSGGRDTADEWRRAVAARHNVLVEGRGVAMEACLRLLEPDLLGPLAHVRAGQSFIIPAQDCATLIVEEVTDLDAADQRRLLKWLEDPSHQTQVISMTAHALFSLVRSGRFSGALYYRLNTVLLRVGDGVGAERTRVNRAAPR